jgi:hypothetical protein
VDVSAGLEKNALEWQLAAFFIFSTKKFVFVKIASRKLYFLHFKECCKPAVVPPKRHA